MDVKAESSNGYQVVLRSTPTHDEPPRRFTINLGHHDRGQNGTITLSTPSPPNLHLSSSSCPSPEWTADVVHQLLDFYQDHPALWNMNHEDYHKRSVRSRLLAELSDQLGGGFDPPVIAAKFTMLRSQYKREQKRVEQTIRTATGAEDIYIPKWRFYQKMNFIMDCEKPYEILANEAADSEDGLTEFMLQQASPPVPVCSSTAVPGMIGAPGTDPAPCNARKRKHPHPNSAISITSCSPMEQVATPMANTPRLTGAVMAADPLTANGAFDLQQFFQQVPQSHEITTIQPMPSAPQPARPTPGLPTTPRADGEDEWHLFGRYTAAILRRLPEYTADGCVMEIQNILAKYKRMAASSASSGSGGPAIRGGFANSGRSEEEYLS